MTRTISLAQAHHRGFEAVRANTERFVDYVDSLGDAALARPVPGLTWTAGQTVAHVLAVFERYTTNRTRSATPAALAAQNDAEVEQLGVDVAAATASIRRQLEVLSAVVDGIDPERRFPFHGGQSVTMTAGWGNLVGELLAHGDDIARATGEPFSVPGEDLEILWRFTAPVLQGWLRPETAVLAESWRLHFPFGPIDALLERGVLHWDHPVDRPTYAIDVPDTVSFTLTVPYRRRAITDAVQALFASRFHDL